MLMPQGSENDLPLPSLTLTLSHSPFSPHPPTTTSVQLLAVPGAADNEVHASLASEWTDVTVFVRDCSNRGREEEREAELREVVLPEELAQQKTAFVVEVVRNMTSPLNGTFFVPECILPAGASTAVPLLAP